MVRMEAPVDPLVRNELMDQVMRMAGTEPSLLLPLLMALRGDEDRDLGMDRLEDEVDH